MRKLGIIRNLKDGAKEAGKNKVKKFLLKRLRGLGRPFLFIGIIAVILLFFILGIFDLGIELSAGENNPKVIYETLDIEDIAELVVIKEDGNGGYYLDFIDDIDEKLQEIIDKTNKGDYHNIPNNIDFLKRMLKAEVYTQFPDLGGTVPEGSDGFQGAVQIRRVTPNKDIGEMENTGRGETSNLEQGTVDEPIDIEDRNDQNKIDNWQSGQRLKIISVETFLYEDRYDVGYWEPILVEGSLTEKVKLQKNDIVTYQGEYKIHNNALTGQQTIYLKVKTDDDLEGYLKTSTVIAVMSGTEEGQATNDANEEIKLSTTSRVEDVRKEIGIEGEEYTVAIAAGRNSSDDLGIVNEEKGLVEEELTIEVAERVEELLSQYSNIKVVQTGSTSDNPDGVKPEDRVEKTRDANPDLCIQIYFGDGEEVGVETIFKEGDQVSQQLADILAENLASSMGLTNLFAGEDTIKCVDSNGNAASLNIIENSVVAGFPSVVAIGGNLNKNPDASVIANDGVEKYAQGIVNGIDEYFKADHSGLVSTEIGEITYTDSVESRIINMRYVSQETMQGYVDEGNIEEAIKCYTLDDNRNVVIASWSMNEDGSVEIKTNNSMNLKTTLQKYAMPYEYLLYFYIDTDYKDFVDDLVNEVMNSEIVIAVQDEINTSHTIEQTEQRTDATIEDCDVDWHETASRDFITEVVNTKVNLTYVSTWCVKTYQENSYSEAVLNLGEEEEKIVEVPGKVTESSTPSVTENVIVDNATGRYSHPKLDENGKTIVDEDGKFVYVTEEYTYDIEERITTNTHIISNSYEKGEYKTEGRENVFVQLYNEHGMIAKVRTTDYLFSIIENNERTANLLDLTKYLIYKATNVPWGVLEFDFEEYSLASFASTSGLYGGTIQEKVWWAVIDAGYSKEAAAGVLGNIEAESGFSPDLIEGGSGIGFGLCQWSFGRRTQLESYAASKGMDPGNENIQVEFLIGEITPGGGADGYASYQLVTYNGYSPSDWENATTPEDAAIAFCWSFERPGIPRMNVRTEAARRYYEQFKDAERPSGGEIQPDNGDGYYQKYTSSTGRTYREYKQWAGSYASMIFDYYSPETISQSGCSITSIAVVTSGYNNNQTPGTLASRVPNLATLLTEGGAQCSGYEPADAARLTSGQPAVVSISGTLITERGAKYYGGHYIAILDGRNGNEVYVSDVGANDSKCGGWANVQDIINIVNRGVLYVNN